MNTLFDKLVDGLKNGTVKIFCNDENLGEPACKIGNNWFWFLSDGWSDYDTFERYLAENSIEARAQQIEQALCEMAEDWEIYGDEIKYYFSILGMDADKYFKN